MRGLRTQQHHVAAATRTETEIVADDDRTRTESLVRNLFDELDATERAEWRPEALDDGRIDTRRSEVVQLGAQVGDARRRLFGREIFAWCRLETHEDRKSTRLNSSH